MGFAAHVATQESEGVDQASKDAMVDVTVVTPVSVDIGSTTGSTFRTDDGVTVMVCQVLTT